MTFDRRTILGGGLAMIGAGFTGFRPAGVRAADAARVVSVGGTLTEIAFALGAGDRIVGADTTSTWPPETEALEKVGYMRRLSAEGVLSLTPDLVLLAPKAGPQTAIDQLRGAGIKIAVAPEGTGLDSVIPKIRFVGETIGRQAKAEQLANQFERDMATLQAQLKGLSARPRVVLLISLSRGAPMAAGADTAAHAMITLAGGQNAITGIDGYKPVSAEALIGAAPDIVLLPQHTADSAGGAEAVLKRPDLAGTPAGKNGRVVVMDALKLLGFGLRTPEAVVELARAFHPAQANAIAL